MRPCLHCQPILHLSMFVLTALLTGGAGSLGAQNNFDLDVLNPGEIMLNLNANEQIDVEQDTLHASLYYAAQGRDRVAIQDEVNRVMATALEVLADSDIDSSTQQYYVYNVPASRPTRGEATNLIWRGQQGILLTSQDSEALLDLVAELQSLGLTMSSLSYSLSRTRFEEVADSLMAAALTKLQARAESVAASLGKQGAEIVEITLNSNNNAFFRDRALMSASVSLDSSQEMAPPMAEPGLSTVTLNVSARAILLP